MQKKINISEFIMINQELANKINCLLDKGVTCGFSKDPKPGEMCLEQVVSYALGEDITDEPSCVGYEVRWFVTRLNDRNWSSPSARAEGMRDLAIAQLGSNSLDQKEFLEKLSFAVFTKIFPAMFRELGEERWKKEIKSLEEAKDLEEARKAASDVGFAYAAYDDDRYRYVAHASDVAYHVGYAARVSKTGDKYLKIASHLAVEVLREMKSPGCQFI